MLVLGLVDIPWWGILLIAVITFLIYDTWDFDYFKKQGIPGPRPVPIFGTLIHAFSKAAPCIDMEALKKYHDKGCYGTFVGTQPMLNVFDRDMLSEITIKQFASFPNRNAAQTNGLNDKMVFNTKDAHWKHMRTEMSPTFTTGKIKRLNSEINRCAQALAESFTESAKADGVVSLREYTGAYTMDVIASTAFGIRLDSQKDRNNAFVRHAKKALEITPTSVSFMMPILFPKLMKFLMKFGFAISLFPKDVQDFFTSITKQTIEMREAQEDKTRTDFLQLMMKAQKGENIHDENETKGEQGQGLTNDEVLANAMVFFVAGYDTTSTGVTFFLYNMARYPDVQDRLVKEINDVIGDAELVDYNLIQGMPYLDQCVNENLRLYPPAVRLDRVASRDITINGVFIRKGMAIGLPYFSIHRDPKRWPNPDEFNPDRFSPENKKKQHPMDFIPFGAGPRMCLAARLALMEIKMAAVHVLRKVKVSTYEKTPIPIIFENNVINLLRAEGGICLKVEPRNMKL